MNRFASLALFGLAACLAGGCGSSPEAVVQTPSPTMSSSPAASPPAADSSAAPAASALRVAYEPDYEFFYASSEDASGEMQLAPGFQKLLWDHDPTAAYRLFLESPGATPEQRLTRALGLGRSSFLLGRWYGLVAELTARANLSYAKILSAAAAEGKGSLEKGEDSVMERANLVIFGAELPEHPFLQALAKEGSEAAVRKVLGYDWNTPTQGRFWDPVPLACVARVFLEESRARFAEAEKEAAGLSAAAAPELLNGIRYHRALACFWAQGKDCGASLEGESGSVSAVLAKLIEGRAKGKSFTLQEVGATSIQAKILAAQFAESSPLQERVELAQEAVEDGLAKLKSNEHLWMGTYQEMTRVVGELLLRQALGAATDAERQALLGSGIEGMRLSNDLNSERNEPLWTLGISLLSLERSGCADLALITGLLNERQKGDEAPELTGLVWANGGINARYCGIGGVEIPTGG